MSLMGPSDGEASFLVDKMIECGELIFYIDEFLLIFSENNLGVGCTWT